MSQVKSINDISSEEMAKRRDRRLLKDRIIARLMTIGGVGVVGAIVLIFFYLLYEVYPLMHGADVEKTNEYSISQMADTPAFDYLIDEYGEVGVRYNHDGRVVVFDAKTGKTTKTIDLPLPAERTITAFATSDVADHIAAVGLDNGAVLVFKPEFKVSYPNDVRQTSVSLSFPLGEGLLHFEEHHVAIEKLALQHTEDGTTLAAWFGGSEIELLSLTLEESFLTDEVTIEQASYLMQQPLAHIDYFLLDELQRNIYIANKKGQLIIFDISNHDDIEIRETVELVERDTQVTQIEFLNGYFSLLVGDSTGRINQWFSVRSDDGATKFTNIRQFEGLKGSVRSIEVEQFRKGFLALDDQGHFGLFHTTAENTLTLQKFSDQAYTHAMLTPRATGLLLEMPNGNIERWSIENEHPDVTWKSLWGKVWYESYEQPEYLWQSSSSSNDFEPKFSLTPLAFGTIKAAFYAMMVAIPIAIFGAIYTAYFMSPGLRQLVKPTIEIMEALPTVILGFLAGLWLAPALEENLVGVLNLILMMPLGILIFSRLWYSLPEHIQYLLPDGWQPVLLIPVVGFIGWFAFSTGHLTETLFFGGDVRHWLSVDMGIPFDQRNSIVVGVAMGFAVIPTIFSITEDAVFSVPKHLTFGSLALGASPWQTMTRVVILTASPGIFSAVMIGFGRAVGETMIVLMATGNTPIMDFSIFQGMRTLSANIAVEVPEAEVASSHYRILFLAALVLFAFTFVFNTIAEVVRQRLRGKYSSL